VTYADTTAAFQNQAFYMVTEEPLP